MTSGEKINQGMSLFVEGLAEVINNVAKEFVKIWDKVKHMLSFADKRITKKRFRKLLQSYGIQRNEINKIIAINKKPYTMSLMYEYVSKKEVSK